MKIKKNDIKKGFRFWWGTYGEYYGEYEVISFTRDLSKIFCYKPKGKHRTIDEEALAKFDKRIVNNKEFKAL